MRFLLLGTLLAACVGRSTSGPNAPATADRLSDPPSWSDLTAGTFARARAENRLVLVDGAAEWCHWCHVMEATTYRDPEVRKLLGERFIAVKVDVDARPDFEERYQEWGWPATLLLTAEGQEIGKYKGYLPPARLAEILRAASMPKGQLTSAEGAQVASAGVTPNEEQIAAVEARARAQLDGLWDDKEGSWGLEQKVPLYWDNAWALRQARIGDATARQRALFTLEQQRKIIDPVWGGICQYSTDGDWLHPHYEKLMAYQAGAIDKYASAYALTGDARWLAIAQVVRGFVDRFMTSPGGGSRSDGRGSQRA